MPGAAAGPSGGGEAGAWASVSSAEVDEPALALPIGAYTQVRRFVSWLRVYISFGMQSPSALIPPAVVMIQARQHCNIIIHTRVSFLIC